ncbi:MAG TPA: glycosyltransferase [Candidatus Dojkabacteria bacterium]|nr:glycosyltransferase [Candidatus Dojkabacteria bacterium]HQF36360.1 glycosyltransferase [Candidatus Dojkabacteria bacterium]
MGRLKVAIVHDWIKSYGGSEQLLLSFKKIINTLDIYTTIYDSRNFSYFYNDKDVNIHFSKLHTLIYKTKLFPTEIFSTLFSPLTVESYNLLNYDLVITNSHSFAHGVITNSSQKHIVYYNTPMRFIWSNAKDYDSIIRRKFGFLSSIMNLYLSYLRIWDFSASRRADHVVSISKTVQERIKKYYKRDSLVIYPPVIAVDVIENKQEKIKEGKGDYYITIGRLVPNKNLEVLVNCFNGLLPDRKLIIVGEGNERKRLQKMSNTNVKFTGFVSDKVKYELLRNAKGFIFCADEDFGIAPLEAMTFGVPVIAYNRGGIREHLLSGTNGTYFDSLDKTDIAESIIKLENTKFDSYEISKTVVHLSEKRFVEEWTQYLKQF